MSSIGATKHLKNISEFCQLRKKHLIKVAKTKRRSEMPRVKFEKDKSFKNELVKFFERNRKSSWGKNQIINIVKDLWIKHLETLVEKQEEE